MAKLPAYLDRDDLQSAGILGYIRAAARYDVAKGASFRGFCAVRISGAIVDEVRRWVWAPRSVHKNNKRITRVTSNLIDQLGREPTRAEMANALGIDLSELADFQEKAQPRQLVSFDEMSENSQGDENLSLAERLADPLMDSPDVAVIFDEDCDYVSHCLSNLPKSEATVIVLHYRQNVPFREIAEILAVTPSRISQLHQQALARLRHTWRKHERLPEAA